jgi:hypothetical protein
MKRASLSIISLRPARPCLRRLRTVALLLGLAISCVQTLEPATNRLLQGTVTNDGEPIRGAVVQLENRATMEIRSYITQQDGQYHFSGLKYDVDYDVWAKRGDKRSPKKTLSQFNEKDSIRIDLILE